MSALIAEGLALAARAEAREARRSGLAYNRAALGAWHAALADRESAPAKVVWLGDSITEGVTTSAYSQRWVDRALAALRTAYPTAGVIGGAGYIPARSDAVANGGVPPAYASLTGGPLGSDNSWGLGGRCAGLSAVGDGATFNVTCSSFQVHWMRINGFGDITISVDGSPVASFSTSGTFGPQVWTSQPLTPGPHAITVTRSAGGFVLFAGLTVFNGDELKGIQGHEGGHFGWATADFAGAQSMTWDALGAIGPQLVTIALGTNDYQSQTPLATFAANLRSIVASIRGVAPHTSSALIRYSRRGDIPVQPIGWDAYGEAIYAVADQVGTAVIDLARRLPDAGAADSIGIFANDLVHYSARGHAAIGEIVAGALRV